jgi:hypothetical protein
MLKATKYILESNKIKLLVVLIFTFSITTSSTMETTAIIMVQ